jgi:hypothetical protein
VRGTARQDADLFVAGFDAGVLHAPTPATKSDRCRRFIRVAGARCSAAYRALLRSSTHRESVSSPMWGGASAATITI